MFRVDADEPMERELLADQIEPGPQLSQKRRPAAQRLGHAAVQQRSLRPSKQSLDHQGVKLRFWAADLAERMANHAEQFAAYLEKSARRGDRERRLAMARTEHEVARIEYQNAARWRDLNTRYEHGEHLPKLPGTTSSPEARPAGRKGDTGD